MRVILTCLILIGMLVPIRALEAELFKVPQLPQLEILDQLSVKQLPEDPKELVRVLGESKGLTTAEIRQIERVINCESRWNTKAVGDGGESYGLVQIHIPAHPHITPEQAMDPEFAINFITDAWTTNDQWMWTCWRILYE
jgi:hypothetical protein